MMYSFFVKQAIPKTFINCVVRQKCDLFCRGCKQNSVLHVFVGSMGYSIPHSKNCAGQPSKIRVRAPELLLASFPTKRVITSNGFHRKLPFFGVGKNRKKLPNWPRKKRAKLLE